MILFLFFVIFIIFLAYGVSGDYTTDKLFFGKVLAKKLIFYPVLLLVLGALLSYIILVLALVDVNIFWWACSIFAVIYTLSLGAVLVNI